MKLTLEYGEGVPITVEVKSVFEGGDRVGLERQVIEFLLSLNTEEAQAAAIEVFVRGNPLCRKTASHQIQNGDPEAHG